jgi:hypothetical protein
MRQGVPARYLADVATGDLYWADSRCVVAAKCLAIQFFNPLYTLGKMTWHLGHLPVAALKGRALSWDLWQLVRSPLYGVAVQLTALYGILCPYEGRKREAQVEFAWQGGVSYREDFRKTKYPKEVSGWEACWRGAHDAQAFYLAYCFQVRGNLRDPHIILRREPA